jgi:hypothetical protein
MADIKALGGNCEGLWVSTNDAVVARLWQVRGPCQHSQLFAPCDSPWAKTRAGQWEPAAKCKLMYWHCWLRQCAVVLGGPLAARLAAAGALPDSQHRAVPASDQVPTPLAGAQPPAHPSGCKLCPQPLRGPAPAGGPARRCGGQLCDLDTTRSLRCQLRELGGAGTGGQAGCRQVRARSSVNVAACHARCDTEARSRPTYSLAALHAELLPAPLQLSDVLSAPPGLGQATHPSQRARDFRLAA